MDAEPPMHLNATARGFWDRHFDRLAAAGLLTPADLDSFAVLCVVWSKLVTISASETGADNYREMVQLNQLTKQYQAYAREFGLMPGTRKRNKLDGDAGEQKDRFGL